MEIRNNKYYLNSSPGHRITVINNRFPVSYRKIYTKYIDGLIIKKTTINNKIMYNLTVKYLKKNKISDTVLSIDNNEAKLFKTIIKERK